jgi:hypothetical protein
MKRAGKLAVVLVFVVAVIVIGAMRMRHAPERERATPVAATSPDPVAPPRVDASEVPSGAQVRAPKATLAGQHMVVQEALIDAIARDGYTAKTAQMVNFAIAICSDPYAVDDPGRKDPERAWAMAYLDRACAGFDDDQFAHLPFPKSPQMAALIARYNGPEAGIRAAEATLRDPDRGTFVVTDGTYLLEQGRFPNQERYNLEPEGLYRALTLAVHIDVCARMGACGPDSLLTANVCARYGCTHGISYPAAMQRSLSAREIETALRMREDLHRLQH